MSRRIATPAASPGCLGSPNSVADQAKSTSTTQLQVPPGPPVPNPPTRQVIITPRPLQSNIAAQNPQGSIGPEGVTRRPPKQWEVMQALLNPEFKNSAPLLHHCKEIYGWTTEDAISFAISGVPEPKSKDYLPSLPRLEVTQSESSYVQSDG
ncbi:hypothetical protein L211DRAFT_888306 [Terfezia boudieri ATCC MYA-4762]|uniref:Uncharacterized protein n=1 Tax=Terfezia boudieri ATCC MYA-4762 TaxID=1051890 RepID=A0A3N4LG36_9PEZI|nr:hypothetical protein L211DRAFT_888306 [Terfezia boudieri ATCC MYA-4762]